MKKEVPSRIVTKPWGHETIWAQTSCYVGKVLSIKKEHRLSFQYHERKDETIHLIKGLLELEIEDTADKKGRRTITLKPGDSYHIPPLLRHRMKALEESEVIEISTPELNDVIRLEDDYGRVKT